MTAVFDWRRLKSMTVVVTLLTLLLVFEPARVLQVVSAINDFSSESDSSGDETEDEEGAGVQTVATLRRKAAVNPLGRLPHRTVVIRCLRSDCARNLYRASCASPTGLGFTLRC